MARQDYPTLSGLLSELKRLDGLGATSEPAKGGVRFVKGKQIGRLHWPGVGDFWLSREQQAVVAVLMEAYFECENPDVSDSTLLRAAGSSETKLHRLFAGSDAFGTLIVRGSMPGTSRLATPASTESPAQDDADCGDAGEWTE